MAKKIKELTPPKGLSRAFFRAPIYMYKAGLGWLMGTHFLLLNHVGRKSGLPRQAVLEVVTYQEERDSYVVTAGFGKKTDWYKNVLAHPEVSVQVGRRKIEATAEQLTPEEAGKAFLEFVKNNPAEASMAKWIGYEVDGSDEDYLHAGSMMPMIAFRPHSK